LLKKNTPVKSKGRKKTADVLPFPEPLSGDAIYTWRTSLGETQAVFAARLRITAASISQWEKKGSTAVGMLPRTLSTVKKAWKNTHQ
jgi:DNA-binding transcriptional regulator YiaG